MLNETEFRKIIGNTIRKIRTNKKYSTEKLAELSDTDYSSINQIENAKQNPRTYTLYKIFYSLGIDFFENILSKSQKESSLRDSVINSIKMLTTEELVSLQYFLDEFTLRKK